MEEAAPAIFTFVFGPSVVWGLGLGAIWLYRGNRPRGSVLRGWLIFTVIWCGWWVWFINDLPGIPGVD